MQITYLPMRDGSHRISVFKKGEEVKHHYFDTLEEAEEFRKAIVNE